MVRSLEGKHPSYFEAILQLRDISEDVLDFVDEEIDRYKIPVTKFKKVKNGFDYYLADKNFARSLGKKLQEKYGGQNLLTTSLVGQKLGKDLHRFTVLFRSSNLKKGEEVDYQGDKYIVKSMGKEMMLQHSKTGKKIRVKFKDMDRIKKI